MNRAEIENSATMSWSSTRLLYDAEEKNFRRFVDFIIHGVVRDDLRGDRHEC